MLDYAFMYHSKHVLLATKTNKEININTYCRFDIGDLGCLFFQET